VTGEHQGSGKQRPDLMAPRCTAGSGRGARAGRSTPPVPPRPAAAPALPSCAAPRVPAQTVRVGDPPWRSRLPVRTLPRRLGPRLRASREQAGLSVYEAARRAHVSSRYVRYLEAGQRVPSREVVDDLVEALRPRPDVVEDLRAVARPAGGRSSPYRRGWRRGDDPDVPLS
jgi:hypothetical protein